MTGAAAGPGEANRLQDAFLGTTRGQKMSLYLANGVRLQGAIIAEDRHCLLLVSERLMQLVYKHAVSTAVPSAAVEIPAPAAALSG